MIPFALYSNPRYSYELACPTLSVSETLQPKFCVGDASLALDPSRSYQTKVKLPYMVRYSSASSLICLALLIARGSISHQSFRESREDKLGRMHGHANTR